VVQRTVRYKNHPCGLLSDGTVADTDYMWTTIGGTGGSIPDGAIGWLVLIVTAFVVWILVRVSSRQVRRWIRRERVRRELRTVHGPAYRGANAALAVSKGGPGERQPSADRAHIG
jgi:hypothetical protein